MTGVQTCALPILFDKNGGDEEGWINHEIAYKGKTIKASNGSLPMKNPTKEDSKFLGWATGKNADKPDFDENTTVSSDITVYSAWKGFEYMSCSTSQSGLSFLTRFSASKEFVTV